MQRKGAGWRPKLHAQCRLDRPINRHIYIYIERERERGRAIQLDIDI